LGNKEGRKIILPEKSKTPIGDSKKRHYDKDNPANDMEPDRITFEEFH
jgi:hypothetical protein